MAHSLDRSALLLDLRSKIFGMRQKRYLGTELSRFRTECVFCVKGIPARAPILPSVFFLPIISNSKFSWTAFVLTESRHAHGMARKWHRSDTMRILYFLVLAAPPTTVGCLFTPPQLHPPAFDPVVPFPVAPVDLPAFATAVFFSVCHFYRVGWFFF